ncbi:MAG: 2-oxoglutarate ferredoxin oxidoreductase subunit alpha [candidate division Zixibacteria bacterium DG_27]|nr:MAG: 2-oxoglutarate ferredoxin oxidoreductase subunit alpha [candidate division Zixibacteria bacterium DG_27]
MKRNDRIRREYLSRFANRSYFMQGDESVAYGSLYAGCDFFAGYPITPASEVAEVMSAELPRVDGYYIQMEDELASLSAVIGAVWAGAKAMTATSGPGFSLMQENIGYAVMTETPCVIVNVQRSGPSTGQATKPAQGDIMQARWGTHGDHEIIALAPNSVQECFDLAIEAFNLSEEYRTPVIILMDGEVGHMREKITMPPVDKVKIRERKLTTGDELLFGGELIPPMAEFGIGRFIHVTGSTHKESGIRDVESQQAHHTLVTRLCKKIADNRDRIIRFEESCLEDADFAVVSYGATARPAAGAVLRARSEDKKVGMLRLITIWPFPESKVRELGARVRKIFVPEMNLGQLSREVERFVGCEVVSIPKIGGIAHTIDEIYSALKGEV